MTPDQEACSMLVIERCRVLNRRMGEQQAALGVRPDDIAIAAAQSAVDLAQHFTGDPTSALAWVRRALDVIEDGAPLTVETMQ